MSQLHTKRRKRTRGQALAEFAIVFPVFMLIVGGIIQFGIIFWGQNTLNQIVRDTGRWAASQTDCSDTTGVIQTANDVAAASSLIGYTTNSWTGSNVKVSWTGTCPPVTNQDVGWVTISITHQVPVFFPLLPGNGSLSSATQFRMEPFPK